MTSLLKDLNDRFVEEFQEQANHRNEELERAQQLEYVPVEVKERGVSQAFKDRVTKEVADVRLSILRPGRFSK